MQTKKKIKICGLNSINQIEIAAKSGACWYGMIFYTKSPRNISITKAKNLVKNSPENIIPVAVTVDAKISYITEIYQTGIKTLQLHGNESPDYCKKIKNKLNPIIIKAISIREEKDLELVDKYKHFVDWIIFDYKSDNVYGGSGKSFNWNILKNKKLNFNWILSGGLDYNNVVDAINLTGANAVDVSSGVEGASGEKSLELIQEFCKTVIEYSRN